MKNLSLLFILVLIPLISLAQNLSYAPIQPSFENESFFYQPNQFSPLNIGPFSQILSGFRSSDPLNKLNQNPAWLPDLKGHDLYAYVNVHSRNTYKSYSPYIYTVAPQSYFIPVYNPYINATGQRLNQEPQLSAAFLGYPFVNKHIFAGIEYHAILSKEKYYAYPSLTYPTGTFGVNTASGSVNPTQFYRKNNLKQTGHFATLYGGYKFSDRTILGLKIDASVYQRNGGYGNPVYAVGIFSTSNNLQPFISSSLTPDLFVEQRNQHYRHLHFDLGGRYAINTRLTGMAHFGYLIGSGDENLNNTAPNYSESGSPNSGNFYLLSESFTTNLATWNNNGHAFNGGISLQYKTSDFGQLRFFYEGYTNRLGLTPSSRIESNYFSQVENPSINNIQNMVTTKQTTTLHSGKGSEVTWTHDMGLFYKVSPVKSLTINFGVQYGHYNRNIHTNEASIVTGLTIIQSTDTTGQTTTTRQPENNTYQYTWRNHLREYSFQLPLIAQLKILNRLEIWGGFNEQIEHIKGSNFNSGNIPYYVSVNSSSNLASLYNINKAARYRFSLISGINFDFNNRFTLHFTALPLDTRYNFQRTNQTSGLIWQAGVSIYL